MLEPNSPLSRLIDALAQQAAEEYLTEQAAARSDSSAECSDRVPLPDLHQAA